MAKHSKELRQERLLGSLEPRLRYLGREVLDLSTSEERLREIIEIGNRYHQRDEQQSSETETTSIWADYSDQELARQLASSEVPGEIKDEIARFVLEREVLPPEKD